jgi:hypothetical protein
MKGPFFTGTNLSHVSRCKNNVHILNYHHEEEYQRAIITVVIFTFCAIREHDPWIYIWTWFSFDHKRNKTRFAFNSVLYPITRRHKECCLFTHPFCSHEWYTWIVFDSLILSLQQETIGRCMFIYVLSW